jgi:hypothetical protein
MASLLFVHTNVTGQLAVILFAAGTNLAVGQQEIVKFKFLASSNASATTLIDFADAPVAREFASTNADPLLASFQGATLRLFDWRLADPALLVQGFQFTLHGPPGVYAIDRSTNLASWLQIDTVTNSNNSVPYLDTGSHTQEHSFYRARKLQ